MSAAVPLPVKLLLKCRTVHSGLNSHGFVDPADRQYPVQVFRHIQSYASVWGPVSTGDR